MGVVAVEARSWRPAHHRPYGTACSGPQALLHTVRKANGFLPPTTQYWLNRSAPVAHVHVALSQRLPKSSLCDQNTKEPTFLCRSILHGMYSPDFSPVTEYVSC